MRTELFSLRSSAEEIDYINQNLKKIVTKLNDAANIKVLFKTEIDSNPRKLKADLISSLNAGNPPEFYIFTNALYTEDISSFYHLFSPFITELEKEVFRNDESKNIKTSAYPNIQIHPITDLPGRYPAYCFTFKRRKYLALPCLSLIDKDFTDYIVEAVLKAKEVFFNAFEKCPDGYFYSTDNQKVKKGKFSLFPKPRFEPLPEVTEEELLLSETKTIEALAPTDINKNISSTVIFDTDIQSDLPSPVIRMTTLADEITSQLSHSPAKATKETPDTKQDVPLDSKEEGIHIPEEITTEEILAETPAEETPTAETAEDTVIEEISPAETTEDTATEDTASRETPEEETAEDKYAHIPDLFTKSDKKASDNSSPFVSQPYTSSAPMYYADSVEELLSQELEEAEAEKKRLRKEKKKAKNKPAKTPEISEDTVTPQSKDTKKESPKDSKESKGKAKEKAKENSKSENKSEKKSKPENKAKDNAKAKKEKTADKEKKNEDTPKKKSKFRSFVRSFIPMKGDSRKDLILKIVVLIAILAFLVGGFMLLKFYVIDPGVNDSNMEEIRGIFYSSTSDEPIIEEVVDENGVVSTIVTNSKPSRNWEGVKKINEEIVGWVKVDGTKIDYPVLHHIGDSENNFFYLYKNYKKEYSDFGSIFVDYHCPQGAESKHVVLHGHNMGSDKDSMFGSLIRYTIKDGRTQANPDYYKSHPVIRFETPETYGDWVIFAVMKIDVSNDRSNIFNYLFCDFENNAQFLNFIYNIKERSYFDINVPINENDRILTLSTCSYESDNMRTVVVARKLRPQEDLTTVISEAKGQSPAYNVSSDFISEYDNIKWYDGNGKPAGDGKLSFMEQGEMFTVKFYDAKGKVIRTEKVLKGEDAEGIVGAPPVKESDGVYRYRFLKWDKSYKNVTKNLEIRPVYEKSLIPPPTEDDIVVTPEPEPKPTAAPTQAPTKAPTQATTQAPTTLPPATQAPATLPPATQAPETEPAPAENITE